MNKNELKTIQDIVTHHNKARYMEHNLEVSQLTMLTALIIDAKGKPKKYDDKGHEVKDPILEYADKREGIYKQLNSGMIKDDVPQSERGDDPTAYGDYWRDQLRKIEGEVDKETGIKEDVLNGLIRQTGYIENPAIITGIILLKWLGSRKRLWLKFKNSAESANFISDELIKTYLPGLDLNTFKGIAQKFPYWFKVIELNETADDGQWGYWLHKDFAGSIPQGQGYDLTTWSNDSHKQLNEMVYNGFLGECIQLSTEEAMAKQKLKV